MVLTSDDPVRLLPKASVVLVRSAARITSGFLYTINDALTFVIHVTLDKCTKLKYTYLNMKRLCFIEFESLNPEYSDESFAPERSKTDLRFIALIIKILPYILVKMFVPKVLTKYNKPLLTY